MAAQILNRITSPSGSHTHPTQLGEALAVDLDTAALRRRRIGLKKLSQMVEQSSRREQNVRRLRSLNAVHEKSCIVVSLRLRFLKPVVGSVLVLRHAVTAETELSQQVLRVGIMPMDNGVACESVDADTGECTTGSAFATCAGFLCHALLTAYKEGSSCGTI